MGRNRLDKGAIYQKNGRFAIAPHIPGGVTDPATLRKIADVAEQFKVDCHQTDRGAAHRPGRDRRRQNWTMLGKPWA